MDAVTIGLILIAVFVIGGVFVIRRVFRDAEGVAEPPPPEYAEAVQNLEELKSGHLWGDIPSDSRLH